MGPGMQNQSILSRTVSWLRFPLIVGVIFLHVRISGGGSEVAQHALDHLPVAQFLCHKLVRGFANVSVPLFFFFAGYFYFYKTQNFGVPVYLKKVRSRVRSLAVPFLVWSALALILIRTLLSFHLLNLEPRWTQERTLFEWLADIYNVNCGMYQFWFLRDLFIVGLLSPLWRILLKNRVVGIAFLTAAGAIYFFAEELGLSFFARSSAAPFFFCAGAFFSIHERDFVEDFSKVGIPALVAFFPLLFAQALTGGVAHLLTLRAFICVAVVAVVFVVSRGIASGKLRESAFLSSASFFVYAAHTPFLSHVVGKFFFETLGATSSNITAIICFFVAAILNAAICVGLYWLVKKIFPWSLPFLTGGR